jgi:sugar/nucleoside kinase (ribokinase family)
MSVPSGERTFFHHKGANVEFSPEDIDLDSLNCDLLHIGYPLLLDRFDERDPEYGTVMARFLHDVQKRGIKTSLDTVSDSTPRFSETVIPALRYCNYAIINEIECCNIWGLEARREDDSLNRENLHIAMQKTLDAGVRDRVIVHCKERAFIMDPEKRVLEVPSLRIPKELIKGSVGAGDAFCAGCLYALFNNYGDKQILEFASSAAACNLFAANSVDGMKNKNEILKMEKIYGRLSE